MRFLETKTHGYLDYVVGILLILLPIASGWELNSAKSIIPMMLGLGAIGYSFITDYEMGVTPVLSMKTHLMIDLASGVLLALSPWLFGFADEVWAIHLVAGLFEVCASLVTKTVPHRSAVGRMG